MTTATMTSMPSEYQPSGHLDSVKARARDLLTCALCVKTFADPRVLPCQHSFCRQCLQTYIDNVVAAEVTSRTAAANSRPANSPLLTRRRTVGSFACPACRADVGLPPAGASAFPVDERIERIRELAIDEMARNISKRLGIARVASAPDNETVDVDNNNKDNSNKVQGRHHYATVGRQVSWSSLSRLGNIDEVIGGGGVSGGRFGADCINEDDDDGRGWESSAFDGRTHGGSAPLFDRFGRRKIGYSSMREARHSQRPSLDSLYGTFTESNNDLGKISGSTIHDSDNDIRFRSARADPMRTKNGSGNDMGDIGNERSFGRSKPLSEQFRAYSQTEFSELPTMKTTMKASVSTSSAFRNPYGDDDDPYIPVIGRHRGSQPLLSSSSLRERRRRAGFDPDTMFNGGEDVLHNGGRRVETTAIPDSPDGWRRYYVSNVGGDYADFMERRQRNQPQHPSERKRDEKQNSRTNGVDFPTEKPVNEDTKNHRTWTKDGTVVGKSLIDESARTVENGSSSIGDRSDKTSGRKGGIRIETCSPAPGSLFKIQEGVRLQDGRSVKVNNENDAMVGVANGNKLSTSSSRGIFHTKTSETVSVDNGRDVDSLVAEPISSNNSSQRNENISNTSSSHLHRSIPDVTRESNGSSGSTTSEDKNVSASPTQTSSGIDQSSRINVTADKVNPLLSPQRPVSPSKDSCFSRLTKFRQTSVSSPRLRSRSSATSTGSEDSGLPSPGPESSPTRLNTIDSEKSCDASRPTGGPRHEMAKPPNRSGVANRPLTKEKVRKRPSLFVGTRLNTPVIDNEDTSAVAGGHATADNSVSNFDTVFSAGPIQTTVARPLSIATSDEQNGNDVSSTSVSVCGEVPGGEVTADQRKVNDWTTDGIGVCREVHVGDEKWGGSEARVTSTSGTSGIGSMTDDHIGSSCPLTPAAAVSPGMGGSQMTTDAVNRRTIDDVFNRDEHDEPIKREPTNVRSATSEAFQTTTVDINPSPVHRAHTVFNHEITIDNQSTAVFSVPRDNRDKATTLQDVRQKKLSDVSSLSPPMATAEASDVDEALFELDSVLDMHVEDHPPSADCASSRAAAPLAACDDSDDLNVASCDKNDQLNDGGNDEHGTRTCRLMVGVEPGHCEAIDNSGRTLEPEIGVTPRNGMRADAADKSTGCASDTGRDNFGDAYRDNATDMQQVNESNESSRLVNDSTSSNPDSSSSKEVSERTVESDQSSRKASKTDGQGKPETKPVDIQNDKSLKMPLPSDRCNDEEEFSEGYVMATGVTSLSDGSLIVADYGAGCLCLFPSVDEDDQDNDDDHVTRKNSDVKRSHRVQHRLAGLKPFSVATNFDCDENDAGSGSLIYVGDRRRKTISVFDRYLSDVAQWPDNRFDWICGIAQLPSTDAGASIVVIDRSRPRHQLVMYTADGRGPIVELGPHGNGDTELCMAEFVAADRRRGRVIVADSGNHCLKTFDPRAGRAAVGRLGDRTARRGAGDGGEMQWPKGLAIDEQSADGVVYVADSRNGRVLAFDAGDGRCIGTAVSGLRGPYAVAVVSPSGGLPLNGSARARLAVTAFTLGGQSEVRLYDVLV